MKLKTVLSGAFDAMIRSYEGKRFWPSLILKLLYALISAVFTALFANTLFSRHSVVNQIFAALFFYFLMVSAGKLVEEIRSGGAGGRLKTALVHMVCLKPPALWFFIAAVVVALFLPYPFALALAVLLFLSAVSGENSLLLNIKSAVVKSKDPAQNGKGLAAFAGGLFVCGLVVCLLAHLGAPTLYGVIDGSGRKADTTQTDSDDTDGVSNADTPSGTGDAADSSTTKPSGNDVLVSGDTNVTEAAQLLTDKLIEYAGKDRKSFEKLFRNTENAAIDQYYNTSYDTFREYGKSLIAIAAQDEDSVWFTALYYRIPANYPAEKEQAVYLSTIMRRAGDGWKIEWNEETRSKLQSDYDNAGFTYNGLDAKEQGYAWAKFFIPFDIHNTMIYYDDAVMCKVTEMYMDINNNVQITLYTANGTDKDIGLTDVTITAVDGDRQLFSKRFDPDRLVDKNNVSIWTLTIPSEELDFTTWSSPKITEFGFHYDELEY